MWIIARGDEKSQLCPTVLSQRILLGATNLYTPFFNISRKRKSQEKRNFYVSFKFGRWGLLHQWLLQKPFETVTLKSTPQKTSSAYEAHGSSCSNHYVLVSGNYCNNSVKRPVGEDC
ncbi:hypothetical protein Tco_0732562 [Tanacetum coccineum]